MSQKLEQQISLGVYPDPTELCGLSLR